MKKYYCKVCKEEIHPKRVSLGYMNTCVKHSASERYTGIIHDTGGDTYEVQIIKSKEIAKELERLSKSKIY
jgi:hypothetical protein